MSRNNQNSKWKAHQQADPKSVVVKEEVKAVKSEPLVPVEVKVDAPVQPVEEKVKPLVKNTKKDVE
jgi:hypothetical protein